MEQLRAGDILLEVWEQEVEHSLMWVADPTKPVVHSASADTEDDGTTNGVIQSSANYFKSSTGKPDAAKPWNQRHRVYRHENNELASAAAWFATQWATRSDHEVFVELKQGFQGGRSPRPELAIARRGRRHPFKGRSVHFNHREIVLDTPYSQDRLGVDAEEWSVFSLFRALRAFHRGTKELPLSRLKGVTCSQFVTYCYQAAALWLKFGYQPLPGDILELIRKNGTEKLKSPRFANLVAQGMQGYDEEYRQAIPAGMLVDAKTTSVEQLADMLADDVTFRPIGFMFARDYDHSDMMILTQEEARGVATWGDLWAL